VSEELAVAIRVARGLEVLGLRYLVGGSVASSLHGVPRATNDIDLLVEVPGGRVDEIVGSHGQDFYVDADMIRDAVRRGGTFNLIHLATGFKVDVFILTREESLQEEMRRREPHRVGDVPDVVYFATAEDTVLQKLAWFRRGGGTSDRQWNDVLGVLKVKRGQVDVAYMTRWAESLGVHDLLERAMVEAG
jgi:hypothetical protein